MPHPRVESQAVRDFATHLAVHRRVSASTQNQALSAILFLCREVLGVEVEDLGLATRAKRGIHLPVVLSMPETAALLGAMSGTTWLMAALIYGGLRVSECCELRIKDLDFDQGLVFVRGGKGAKDRATLLAELGRDELRRHLQCVEARYRADRAAGLAGVWMPEALERKYPNAGRELGWFWVFPSHTLSTDPRALCAPFSESLRDRFKRISDGRSAIASADVGVLADGRTVEHPARWREAACSRTADCERRDQR